MIQPNVAHPARSCLRFLPRKPQAQSFGAGKRAAPGASPPEAPRSEGAAPLLSDSRAAWGWHIRRPQQSHNNTAEAKTVLNQGAVACWQDRPPPSARLPALAADEV